MTLPYVKISHSLLTPTEVRILCNNVTVDWKNNNDSKPNANGTVVSEINTQSFENPGYNVSGIRFMADTTTLQYSHLLKLSKIKYDGTNAPILKVHYGNDIDLVASDNISTSIKVIVENWTFPIDMLTSKNGYVPIVNLKFRETD
jgi:hypothetical protein